MSDKEIYPIAVGWVVNAYVEAVTARAVAVATGGTYDEQAHAAAATAFDGLLKRLAEDSDLLDYLDDWFSGGHEIVLACSREPGVRQDREGNRDRLWINEFEGWPHETVRTALQAARDAEAPHA